MSTAQEQPKDQEQTQKPKTEYKNVEVGALWKRQAKSNGQTYLSGHVKQDDGFGEEKQVKVVVFSNKNKKSENAPDFRIYLSNLDAKTASTETASTEENTEAKKTTEESLEETL
tara:strand:- start:310 stop:651 length:342 start_codon:yes stop_codon:yes gene_type:complete